MGQRGKWKASNLLLDLGQFFFFQFCRALDSNGPRPSLGPEFRRHGDGVFPHETLLGLAGTLLRLGVAERMSLLALIGPESLWCIGVQFVNILGRRNKTRSVLLPLVLEGEAAVETEVEGFHFFRFWGNLKQELYVTL